ncbi:uncharacterized protein K441DRAFT_675178 [Cenococcum geophilum 1.58]|uniref:uncharacterized protein n=1 Tax=Cenococcum geophilum 1.58 TaxID=794803 RepID=UPI00358F4E5D|nr:hypothetical protein K441DRAFT_675178 [Cenococcum geophilum 1.58]
MQGYTVSPIFPTPPARSGAQSIGSTPAREMSQDGMSQDGMSQDDSRGLSEQGRYWYRQGKAVTHVQLFTNLVGLQKPRANSEVESTPIPIHALQPLNDVNDHAPTTGTTAFIRAKRELIKEGWPIEQVLGSEELDINLLSPKGASEIQNPHLSNLTVGQWAGNIFEGIKDIKTPEKLAMTLLGVLFLRWSILPSSDLYQKLPEWMRPTPIQTIVPHPQWIDFVPWPEARDLFISDPINGEMTDAFQTLMMNVSINWPWQISELITLRTDVDSLLLNPTFEQYVKDINNWSLNPAALVVFPALINKVWVNPDPDEEEHFPYEVASQGGEGLRVGMKEYHKSAVSSTICGYFGWIGMNSWRFGCRKSTRQLSEEKDEELG